MAVAITHDAIGHTLTPFSHNKTLIHCHLLLYAVSSVENLSSKRFYYVKVRHGSSVGFLKICIVSVIFSGQFVEWVILSKKIYLAFFCQTPRFHGNKQNGRHFEQILANLESMPCFIEQRYYNSCRIKLSMLSITLHQKILLKQKLFYFIFIYL